jgi:hypothetical protein
MAKKSAKKAAKKAKRKAAKKAKKRLPGNGGFGSALAALSSLRKST